MVLMLEIVCFQPENRLWRLIRLHEHLEFNLEVKFKRSKASCASQVLHLSRLGQQKQPGIIRRCLNNVSNSTSSTAPT
jgi:hypothetical protein